MTDLIDPGSDPLLLGDLHLAGPLGRTAIIRAHAEIGTTEQPRGSNRGPRVELYQVGIYEDAPYLLGMRWCGRFARWCIESAARDLGMPPPFRGWGDLGSAIKWLRQAKNRRCWIDVPAPGRVGLHLDADGVHGHVTLVVKVEGGEVISIEGNESDQVAVRRRPVAYYGGGFVEVGRGVASG